MKSNFLNELYNDLYFLDQDERMQVIADYETHIDERMREGLDENVVLAELGPSRQIAIDYADELGIKYSSTKRKLVSTKRRTKEMFKGIGLKTQNARSKLKLNRNDKLKTVENENGSKSFANSIFVLLKKLLINIVYLVKLIIAYCIIIFKFAIKCCIYLFILALVINVVLLLLISLLLPIFLTFINYTVIIWGLIYTVIICIIYINSLLTFSIVSYLRRS